MKHILPFCVLLLALSQTAAASTPELTMLFFYQNGCPWCARMDKVLADPAVSSLLSRHDRLIRVDVNQEKKISETGKSGVALSEDLAINSTPTILFIDDSKKIVLKIPGALEKDDFLDIVCQYHPGMEKEKICRNRIDKL